MLLKLRQNIFGQALLLAIFVSLAAAVEYFGAYHPPLRLSLKNCFRGVIGGVFALLFVWTFHALLLQFFPAKWRKSLSSVRALLLKQSAPARLGSSVSTAAGEEFFLRGYAFGFLMWDSFWTALALNIVVVAALHYRGREHVLWTLARTAEGVFYCLLFYAQTSLALNAVARFTESMLSALILRSQPAGRVLGETRFSWRMIYDKAYAGSRVSHRV